MRAFDLIYREKGEQIYFESDGEEISGTLESVEVGDEILVCYMNEKTYYRTALLNYDDEVTVVQPLGRKE